MKIPSLPAEDMNLLRKEYQVEKRDNINRISVYINSLGVLSCFMDGSDGIFNVIPGKKPVRLHDGEHAEFYPLIYGGCDDLFVPPSWHDCDCTEDIDMGTAFAAALESWIQHYLLNPKNGLSADKLTFVYVNCPERQPWKNEADAYRSFLWERFSKFFSRVYVELYSMPEILGQNCGTNCKNGFLLLDMDGQWCDFSMVDSSRSGGAESCSIHIGFEPGQNPNMPVNLRMNEIGSDSTLFWNSLFAPNWKKAFNAVCTDLFKAKKWRKVSVYACCPDEVREIICDVLKESGYRFENSVRNDFIYIMNHVLLMLDRELRGMHSGAEVHPKEKRVPQSSPIKPFQKKDPYNPW